LDQAKRKKLPDLITPANAPDFGKLDELELFIGSKNKVLL